MNPIVHALNGLLGRARRERIEWISLFALLGTSCVISAYFFNNDRRTAHDAEVARLEAQARIVDENLQHQLEGARGALDNVVRAADPRHGFDATQLETVRNAMPGVRALAIVDGRGTVVAAGDERALPARLPGTAPAEARDSGRLYLTPFGAGQDGQAPRILLSLEAAPVHGRAGLRVAATLDASYFDTVMRSVRYAADMHTALFDSRAGVLLYSPPDAGADALAAAFPADAMRRAMRLARSETIFRTAPDAGDARLVVYRRVRSARLQMAAPLAIAVSRSVAAIDAPWRRIAVIYFSAWFFVAALTAFALFAVQHRRRLLEQSADERRIEREQHAARIELALAGADLGLWDWHLPSGRRVLNERGAAMLGYTVEECETIASFYKLVHPDDADAVRRVLHAHLQGEAAGYEAEFRMKHRRDGWVWVHCRGKVVERDAAGAPLRIMGTRMDITERKASEEKIYRLAYYDGLTLLPNRRLLLERLDHALHAPRTGKCYCAVLFLDLDRFKQLNDTLGHDIGDRLLRSVASRLQDVVRCADTVARLGGDEFVVVLEHVADSHEAARDVVAAIGAKLLGQLEQPHLLGGHVIRSSSSIGATLFSSGDGDVATLLKQADMAMYEAKANGGGTLCFFDPAMQRRIEELAAIEQDLRAALALRQFSLHYQPIVDAQERPRAVEALLRWTHPVRGAVRPDEFIAVAERTGLILPLGHWVIEQACALLVDWAHDAARADHSIAVNVSARQFRQPDFVSRVKSVLRRTGANPGRLKLELTESMLLEDVEEVGDKMRALRACGIGFSLDDFGTGYSSLVYLKKLPLSQLKIDRSFVQDVLDNPNDAAIARTIIALGHSLGLEVVAEGVETRAQFDFLSASGCTYFQGYLFGKPAPVAASATAPASS